MPNLQSGMTGDKLIEEVNSALDKRGNPDGSGTQEINEDINLKGNLIVDGKILSPVGEFDVIPIKAGDAEKVITAKRGCFLAYINNYRLYKGEFDVTGQSLGFYQKIEIAQQPTVSSGTLDFYIWESSTSHNGLLCSYDFVSNKWKSYNSQEADYIIRNNSSITAESMISIKNNTNISGSIMAVDKNDCVGVNLIEYTSYITEIRNTGGNLIMNAGTEDFLYAGYRYERIPSDYFIVSPGSVKIKKDIINYLTGDLMLGEIIISGGNYNVK